MDFQTIIIGAGPAGLIAGKYLKDALILEAKKEIGKPVRCGEGISVNALRFQNIVPDPKWISIAFQAVYRIMPNGKIIGKEEAGGVKGYVINRVKFEQFLAEDCAGRIKMNSMATDIKYEGSNWVVLTTNGERLKCKYLIGADGPTSIIARKVFNEKFRLRGAAEYLVKTAEKLPVNRIEMRFGNRIAPGGYAWIFPKSAYTANIGIECDANPLEKLDFFLENTVRKNYGDYEILENRSGAIPYGGPLKTLAKNNALVIGDAAGLTDPIFKGGVSQAMFSAKIAAECVTAGDVQNYEKKIRSLPFCDPNLMTAREIFYSLSDEVLNALGNFLEDKKDYDFKNPAFLMEFFSNPELAGSSRKILKFFSIWKKNSDWLW